MSYVEVTSDIRKRHNDNKRLLIVVYFGSKVALLEPEIIPLVFYSAWLIGFRYFGHF
jgi:hypothetical protein